MVALFTGVTAAALPCHACERAQAETLPDELPEPWRAALDELLEATGQAGQPWACGGGRLELALSGDGAVLRVERPGAEKMTRRVRTPEELVVAGKAMLATLVAPTAEPRPPPPNDAPEIEEPRRAPVPAPKGAALQPVAVPAVPDADRQPEATGPRLLVDGVGAVRYHGAIDALTAGGAARMSVPLGFVMPALWVRYTALIDHGGPGELEFTDLDIGASLGFAVLDEPVRLTVGLHGSLAIVDIESEDEREEEREVDLVALDGRLGTELRLSVPIVSLLRFMAALDGSVAPASLADDNRRIAPSLPPLPAYGVGVSAGLEVEVP